MHKLTQEGGNNQYDEHIFIQCGLPGLVKVNCVSYKHLKVWWKVKKPTATAAFAITGDFDPF
jgi:hypothetical protein